MRTAPLPLLLAIACAEPAARATAVPPAGTVVTPEPEPPAPPPIPEPSGDHLTLVRTGCHGTCPIYTLSLYASGVAVFHGEHFVATVGDARRAVDPTVVRSLLDAAARIDFAALPTDTSVGCGHGMPGVSLAVRIGDVERFGWVHGGFTLELCDHHGRCEASGRDRARALGYSPEAMTELERLTDRIDAEVPTLPWVGEQPPPWER